MVSAYVWQTANRPSSHICWKSGQSVWCLPPNCQSMKATGRSEWPGHFSSQVLAFPQNSVLSMVSTPAPWAARPAQAEGPLPCLCLHLVGILVSLFSSEDTSLYYKFLLCAGVQKTFTVASQSHPGDLEEGASFERDISNSRSTGPRERAPVCAPRDLVDPKPRGVHSPDLELGLKLCARTSLAAPLSEFKRF